MFRSNTENITEFLKHSEVALYGLTYWSACFNKTCGYKVSFIIDKKALYLNGIPVISVNDVPVIDIMHFKEEIKKTTKQWTVIVCAGLNKGTVDSIYRDLLQYNINANVINIFENRSYFCDDKFVYREAEYWLFEHPYNCGYRDGRMTERSVEMCLAKHFIESCDELIEIGAVTPYYFSDNRIKQIIDPTDSCGMAVKKSLFECNLEGKNVLSISTVEHIGTSDYGMHEVETSVDAINKILLESRSCLITAPLGYNYLLDQWVYNNKGNHAVRIMQRDIRNNWRELPLDEYCFDIEYTPLWANGLVIIEKFVE